MPSTLLTAASDIFVIAGAAAVATAALNSKFAAFDTSLGTERDDDDDDSLVAAETNNNNNDDVVSTLRQRSSPYEKKNAETEKKVPIVTVCEVAVTPPLDDEIQEGDDFFSKDVRKAA